MNEKNFVALKTPYLGPLEVKGLFRTFRRELEQKGWRTDATGTRFHHPHFLFRTARSSLGAVFHRGLQKGDLIRLISWLKGKY